jgi:dihydroorotase
MTGRAPRDLLLCGGRVVDPASGQDGPADVLLSGGRVVKVESRIEAPDAEVLDCGGCVVAPGFVDMHVHLREPGQEYKETVATGTRAAVAGGFSAVGCMANTVPPNDAVPVTQAILRIAREEARCRVWPIAAVTKGMAGKELTEFGELKRAGAVALSDDGKPIADHAVMRRALEYAGMFDLVVIDHAEDPSLAGGAVAHEGAVATRLGLRGMPHAAEDLHVARDVMLAELTGSAVHVAHLSTSGALDLVRRGRRAGVRVTCEVTPHHFTLDEARVAGFDTAAKMKPPLRTAADVKALLRGLEDGTVDCIATDHAPHHSDEKDVPFDEAAFGIVGLETAVALAVDRLVHAEVIDVPRLVALLSWNPARILGVPGGTLAVGAPADVTVLDLERRVVVDPRRFQTKGRSTPFAGLELRGGPMATIVGGEIAWTVERGVVGDAAARG